MLRRRLTAIVAASAQAFRAVQLAGAAYLIILGIRGWRAARPPLASVEERPGPGPGFRAGLVSNVLNQASQTMPPARKKRSAVFSTHGHLGSPAAVTAGFRPALWSCVVFATLAAVTAVGITAARRRAGAQTHAADVPVAA